MVVGSDLDRSATNICSCFKVQTRLHKIVKPNPARSGFITTQVNLIRNQTNPILHGRVWVLEFATLEPNPATIHDLEKNTILYSELFVFKLDYSLELYIAYLFGKWPNIYFIYRHHIIYLLF